MRLLTLFAAATLLFTTTAARADVIINELRLDQPGSDTDEFVEFYSSTGMNLNGISFVILQDNGVIDGIVDLTGFSIAAGDVFLIAETNPLPTSNAIPDLIASLNLENGENSCYLLVDGLTASVGTDLDADDDGVFDAALPWTTLLNGVALVDDEASIIDPIPGPEDINYGPVLGIPVVGPDGTFYPGHVYASVDGGGIDSIGLFDPTAVGNNDTPGQLNVSAVPEPSSMIILSGIGLAIMTRRRRS